MKIFDGNNGCDIYLKPDKKIAKKQNDIVSVILKSGMLNMTYFAFTFKLLNF